MKLPPNVTTIIMLNEMLTTNKRSFNSCETLRIIRVPTSWFSCNHFKLIWQDIFPYEQQSILFFFFQLDWLPSRLQGETQIEEPEVSHCCFIWIITDLISHAGQAHRKLTKWKSLQFVRFFAFHSGRQLQQLVMKRKEQSNPWINTTDTMEFGVGWLCRLAVCGLNVKYR